MEDIMKKKKGKYAVQHSQLINIHTDSPSDGHAALEYISDGERIEIECSAAESNVENLIFLKDEKEIKSALRIEGKNKILIIGKFDGTKHARIYHYATPTSNGALEPTMMLKRYNPVVGTPYVKECEENMCRNSGKCFVPFTGDKTSFCLCPSDYAGQYCHAISSYTGNALISNSIY
uniref:EGF-like domain-containing protein n=1 Tax=Setaria digitata TaxID=48799 RepID=A0A915PVN3_9BILA